MIERKHPRTTAFIATAVTLAAAATLALTATPGLAQGSANTLRVGSSTEPPTLDPQRDAGGPASEVEENIYNTLVAFSSSMKLQPSLATSWTVSQDGKTYTFKLRKGVKFHDGTAFNADAVKFTFDRALGKIDGKKSRYATLMSQLDNVEVVDDYTVRFHNKNAFAPFLNNLAHLGHSILSPTAVKKLGENFGRQPVGTGPFKFAEWRTGQQVTIEKNPNYWRPGVPLLNAVQYRYIPDAATRVVTLESGGVDVALDVAPADFKRLQQNPDLKTYKANTLRTVFLMFNPNMKPFDDIAVRQAIAESINRTGIASALLEGLHRPALRPTFTPGVWGVSRTTPAYTFDTKHAAQVLDQAGWKLGSDGVRVKDGRPLQFTLYTTQNRYPQDTEIGAYLRTALGKALGAKVDLGTFEWETYRDNIFQKKLGLFMFGAGVSTGDIDYVMTILFHSSSQYTQAKNAMEDKIIQAQTIVDPKARAALYDEIQAAIAKQYLWIPLYWQSALHASRANVVNFAAHPLEKVNFERVSLK